MAWKNNFDNYGDGDDDRHLIYDLRQIYAVNIVGETLKQISAARKMQDFPQWFKLLKRDLRTEISKGLKVKEIEEVDLKVEDVKKVIKENSAVYLRQSKDAKGFDAVEEALINFEIHLMRLMEKHKMFGSKEEPEPL